MIEQQTVFDDLQLGQALPQLVKHPTPAMLFRFSAVTWNAHRIHYDTAFARSEGHEDVLVQATMHGAFLLQMISAFAGLKGRVLEFEYANRGKASPGDILTIGGSITDLDARKRIALCDLWERKQGGELCASGSARVELPTRRQGPLAPGR